MDRNLTDWLHVNFWLNYQHHPPDLVSSCAHVLPIIVDRSSSPDDYYIFECPIYMQ